MYSINRETVSDKPKLLINDIKPGEDVGRISWYPESHVYQGYRRKGGRNQRNLSQSEL